MRKKIACIFTLWLNIGFTQSLCLPIKYIEVFTIPTNLHTTLTLDQNDIRLCNYPFSKHTIIKDSTELSKFTEINFFPNKTGLYYNSITDIKAIIDIHFEDINIITIELDSKLNYKIDNKKYICNSDLKNWLYLNKAFNVP